MIKDEKTLRLEGYWTTTTTKKARFMHLYVRKKILIYKTSGKVSDYLQWTGRQVKN